MAVVALVQLQRLRPTPPAGTARSAPVAAQVPVVAGEIGQNTCAHDYIDQVMAWADAHGVGYLAWTWNPWGCSQRQRPHHRLRRHPDRQLSARASRPTCSPRTRSRVEVTGRAATRSVTPARPLPRRAYLNVQGHDRSPGPFCRDIPDPREMAHEEASRRPCSPRRCCGRRRCSGGGGDRRQRRGPPADPAKVSGDITVLTQRPTWSATARWRSTPPSSTRSTRTCTVKFEALTDYEGDVKIRMNTDELRRRADDPRGRSTGPTTRSSSPRWARRPS